MSDASAPHRCAASRLKRKWSFGNEGCAGECLLEDWCRAVTDKREAGPIDRKGLVAEFSEKIQLRFTKRRAFVRSVDEMLVEAFHQSDRERVVGGPQTPDHRLCAGHKDGT